MKHPKLLDPLNWSPTVEKPASPERRCSVCGSRELDALEVC
jgi:hypothetical protein